MHFKILGQITEVEVIATGTAIRERKRLRKNYGKGRWRKVKVRDGEKGPITVRVLLARDVSASQASGWLRARRLRFPRSGGVPLGRQAVMVVVAGRQRGQLAAEDR